MYTNTPLFYQVSTSKMKHLQGSLQNIITKLSNQKRVATPADDPVAAARILQLRQSQGQNSQYIENTKAISSQLLIVETAVKSASDLIVNMKALAVQAGNGSLNGAQRQAMQIQVQQGILELAGYANATDGRGQYLFSGNQIDVPPFNVSLTPTPFASYQGDTGQRNIQVSDTRKLTISDPGSTIFGQPGGSATAAFDALIGLHNLLSQNPNIPGFANNVATVINNIDTAQQQLALTLSSIGARAQENNNLQKVGQHLGLQYTSSISDLEDLDMVEEISNYTRIKTSLEYAQQTYVQASKLSLFNYMQ